MRPPESIRLTVHLPAAPVQIEVGEPVYVGWQKQWLVPVMAVTRRVAYRVRLRRSLPVHMPAEIVRRRVAEEASQHVIEASGLPEGTVVYVDGLW